MSTQKELRELSELVTMKPKVFEKAKQSVMQALEKVELNNQWKINSYLLLVSRLNHMARSFLDSDDGDSELDGNNSQAWWSANLFILLFNALTTNLN